MTTHWIIPIALFAIFMAIVTWGSWRYYTKRNNEKTWKIWGLNISYWEGVVTLSSGLSILTLFLLKWTNLFHF